MIETESVLQVFNALLNNFIGTLTGGDIMNADEFAATMLEFRDGFLSTLSDRCDFVPEGAARDYIDVAFLSSEQTLLMAIMDSLPISLD